MRLHVVDGTFELYRAHFAQRPPHLGPDGRDLKATVGIAAAMLALLDDKTEAPTHLAVAFDNPIRSFRNDLFDGYKTDEGVPPELRAQFDSAEEAVRAVGIVVWSMDEFEADDALATAATRFAGEVEQVRLLTPDKDLGQVVRGTQIIEVDRLRDKEIDEAAVIEKFGVPPAAIPDYLGLVGDTSDGIPGVPGFGAKTAAALLSEYGRIEAIPADPSRWPKKVRGAERLSASLESMREEALLYRRLATLRTDVPLRESLADLEFRGTPRDRFEAFCEATASDRMRSRPKRWR
ncbi:MAG: 5'-3' exonuclease H3TH domain-containing protein [Myxococcota bacterium]